MKTLLFACAGSRGDVEPFTHLATALRRQHGHRVIIATGSEYEELVVSSGAEFTALEPSLPGAFKSDAGQAVKGSNLFTLRRNSSAFLGPIFRSWFESLLNICKKNRPDLLLMTSFVLISGSTAIPSLCPWPMKLVIAHLVPAQVPAHFDHVPLDPLLHYQADEPTSAFAPPTLGAGQTLGCRVFNTLSWRFIRQLLTGVYRPLIAALYESHSVDPCDGGFDVEWLESRGIPVIYCYSRLLLPRPPDWGYNAVVVGALLSTDARPAALDLANDKKSAVARTSTLVSGNRSCGILGWQNRVAPEPPTALMPDDAGAEVFNLQPPLAVDAVREAASTGFSPSLTAFVRRADQSEVPLIYIGLGSMLGVLFQGAEGEHLLKCVADGVELLQRRYPCLAIIHTVTGAKQAPQLPEPATGAPYMWLHEPVSHAALFPRCDLVVHHGGAGTTHAVLAAGKPALILPASQQTDQPFWADIVRRQGLGPTGFLVSKLTAQKLADALAEGISGLERFSRNAAQLGAAMQANEDGVTTAAELILQTLT